MLLRCEGMEFADCWRQILHCVKELLVSYTLLHIDLLHPFDSNFVVFVVTRYTQTVHFCSESDKLFLVQQTPSPFWICPTPCDFCLNTEDDLGQSCLCRTNRNRRSCLSKDLLSGYDDKVSLYRWRASDTWCHIWLSGARNKTDTYSVSITLAPRNQIISTCQVWLNDVHFSPQPNRYWLSRMATPVIVDGLCQFICVDNQSDILLIAHVFKRFAECGISHQLC